MTGSLAVEPLVEVIRAVLEEKSSGALRVGHERVKMVFYYERGALVYATANLKQYRLADSLQRGGHLDAARLAQLQNPPIPDLKLAQILLEKKLVARDTLTAVFSQQAAEMFALALSWTQGEWQWEARVRPAEKFELVTPFARWLLEAARKLPRALVLARWQPAQAVFRPARTDWMQAALTWQEGFLLTRLSETPSDITALATESGLPVDDIRFALYGLAVAGWITGATWPDVLTAPVVMPTPAAPPVVPEVDAEAQQQRLLEQYLERVEAALNHYGLFSVAPDADAATLKDAYYSLARKFHPDRYRQADAALHKRVENAFALLTRAYEVLKDPDQRARYDARLALERPDLEFTTTPAMTAPTVAPAPSALPKASPAPPVTPPVAAQPTAPPSFTPPTSAPPVTPAPRTTPVVPPFARLQPNAPPITPPPTNNISASSGAKLPPRPTTPTPLIAPPPVSLTPPPAPAPVLPRLPPVVPVDAATQKRADNQFQRGLSALASGDYIAAISCLAEAVRLVPHQANYRAYFGRALSAVPHSHRQAETEASLAVQLDPKNSDYRMILAEILWNIGFPVRAQGELERILAQDPFHRDARALREKVNAATLKK